MDEYVGWNINGDYDFAFTQPVMLQIFSYEFALQKLVPNTPTMSGKTMMKSTEENVDPPE